MCMKHSIGIGIIGFGRMGEFYFLEMLKSPLWSVLYVCDIDENTRRYVRKKYPNIQVVDDENIVFNDEKVEVVGLFALANSRFSQIEKAIKFGKHIIAEKPIADTVAAEKKAVELVENSNILATVNLCMRNSWTHNTIKSFIESGEIGELAIIRICHMTPGLMPGEGHEYEGPAFHDCGMHCVDLARWYAGSEYKTWNAQAIRMWSYKEPWWLQCHGTFENGVVFDITQGFVYGQMSKDQTHNSYVDIIGTKGIARMSHDFKDAVVDLRGITQTKMIKNKYGGKNIDVLCDLFAKSFLSNKLHRQLPIFRDAAIASQFAWNFLDNAKQHDLPAIGSLDTLKEILERRKNMLDGYGLLNKRNRSFPDSH